VPIALLNWATMSSFAAERSVPASLLASAWGKYVFEYGAFGKLAWTVTAPAEPSVALDAEQLRLSMVDATLIATALDS
jgi:hypothetical protein